MRVLSTSILLLLLLVLAACNTAGDSRDQVIEKEYMTASAILSNPDYLAISYGGYRDTTRNIQPSIYQLKNDLRIMAAMGVKVIRTYNMQLPHAPNVVKAIDELSKEDPDFEMYVMLGAWIDCKNAWTNKAPDHSIESPQNAAEIDRAVVLARKYPDIIKVIAVGNEAMVKWATSYYVQPAVILKWVKHLQSLKEQDLLNQDIWITSSDNFASWGGGDSSYHTADLNELIKSVDYISMHTYPMHDTHYNPIFWGVTQEEVSLGKEKAVHSAMSRATNYAIDQYDGVKKYMLSLGVDKPVHIGETGWASYANDLYGDQGSRATDEYKEGLFYKMMREWTTRDSISCFYFEAFDEQWKDAGNPLGSENHFGLFTIDGRAKYALWDLVDNEAFEGLIRNGKPITKTYDGNINALMKNVKIPPIKSKFTGYVQPE